STNIGRNCKIGGAAMISGHLEIVDGTVVSAATAVFDSIRSPGVYTGTFPALPHREWRHVASAMRRLRSIVERLRGLERTGTGEAGKGGRGCTGAREGQGQNQGAPAAPVSVSDGGSRAGVRRRCPAHQGGEERQPQRAVLSGTFSGLPGHAGRAGDRGDGAGL